jgi:hypothetical protein
VSGGNRAEQRQSEVMAGEHVNEVKNGKNLRLSGLMRRYSRARVKAVATSGVRSSVRHRPRCRARTDEQPVRAVKRLL